MIAPSGRRFSKDVVNLRVPLSLLALSHYELTMQHNTLDNTLSTSHVTANPSLLDPYPP